MPDASHAERSLGSRRVVLPGGMRPASIEVHDGVIARVGPYDARVDENYGELVIMPGLVDTHVHINEPGRADWEGFVTATQAAAAGGVTTLIDMPLNSIPTTVSVGALETKIAAAHEQCWVDVGFWGGVIPGNAREIRPLWEAGCFGFKCFLAPSGVDDFPRVTESDLRQAMPEIAACGGVLLAHAEDPAHLVPPDVILSAAKNLRGHQSGTERHSSSPSTPQNDRAAGPVKTVYASYLESRPCRAEDSAIELLIRLSRETGCRVHVVHLSSSGSLPQLRAARATGVPVTVETCPHYLAFEAEAIPDGATEFKCAPPIRERANREELWSALGQSEIDFVVSDHSPCPPMMKCQATGDFFSAWGGISSLELGPPAIWTAARQRGAQIGDIARWMSSGPAEFAGLARRKGSIAVGLDADLVIWDPEAAFTVDTSRLRQRHKLTPYAGRRLSGVVRKTILRGRDVQPEDAASGRILRRHEL
ncbi:MAG TPA: amidohydrolase family protein [Terriglobia bacterium]|nr:amidohydrolase family protein [Terriglobia bacterium]